MLRSVIEWAAYGFAAILAAICLFAGAWKWGGWSWAAVSRQLRRSALAVLVAMAVVATMKAQKGDRGPGTTSDPPAPAQQTGTTGGSPAAGTFRNISLRMPNPGVRYFGWFFRHWESNEVVIASSTLNASGATDVRGIYAIDSPPMSVENCTFVNFPPAGGGTLGYGIQYETTPTNAGGTAQMNFVFGDVDGDGVFDAQEREEGTDPYDGGNFRLVATVNVVSLDVVLGLTNYVAWGYVPMGWEENGLDSLAK